MEYKGNEPNVIHYIIQRSGGNADGNKVTITNAATEFHVYKTIWTLQIFKYLLMKLFHSKANDKHSTI
jgi:hypothetical protein